MSGEQPPPAEVDPWKSIVVGFEHVKAEVVFFFRIPSWLESNNATAKVASSIESLTAQKAPEQGQAPDGVAAGAEGADAPPPAQSAFDLEQISKQVAFLFFFAAPFFFLSLSPLLLSLKWS